VAQWLGLFERSERSQGMEWVLAGAYLSTLWLYSAWIIPNLGRGSGRGHSFMRFTVCMWVCIDVQRQSRFGV
jgi:hypothetical protein